METIKLIYLALGLALFIFCVICRLRNKEIGTKGKRILSACFWILMVSSFRLGNESMYFDTNTFAFRYSDKMAVAIPVILLANMLLGEIVLEAEGRKELILCGLNVCTLIAWGIYTTFADHVSNGLTIAFGCHSGIWNGAKS